MIAVESAVLAAHHRRLKGALEHVRAIPRTVEVNRDVAIGVLAHCVDEIGQILETHVARTPPLPPQWNCPHCGYGEYKNRADWEQRAADHADTCPNKPETNE